CADVVAALALIAALALDPTATHELAPASEAAPAPTPTPAPPAPPPPPAAPAPLAANPVSTPVSVPDSVDALRARGARTSRISFSWGAGGVTALGIAPEPLFGAGLSVDVTPARDRLFTWLVRLSGTALFPRAAGTPLEARFGGEFLSLEGCPLGF